MARPKEITDQQILEAAREVFLEQGLAGTTAEIARRAGVSEGSIFRRFPTKKDLFHVAMGFPSDPPFLETIETLVGRGDPRESLVTICTEILAFFLEIVPKTIILLSARGINPAKVFVGQKEPPPVRGVRALTSFLEREQWIGRIGACTPEVIARMLLGALHSYAFFEVSGMNTRSPMPETTYVRGIVDTVFDGIGSAESDG